MPLFAANLHSLSSSLLPTLSPHHPQDQFDVIDFSDNDIKRLDNFPAMQRLNALIVNNNSVARIGAGLAEHLPKLTTVILTNNRLAHMSEIDRLAECKLESLSLLDNPIATKSQYRLYVIYKIPSLKWLDFRKVQQSEREESAKFFKTAAGKAFLAAVAQESKYLAEGGAGAGGAAGAALQLSEEQKALVKKAIEAARTKEDIDNIERQLKVRTMLLHHSPLFGLNALWGVALIHIMFALLALRVLLPRRLYG